MNKTVHPAAIALALAACVVLAFVVFAKFGSSDVKGVPLQESMKIDANAHNSVNSITGEPLLPDQLDAQEKQRQMIRRMQDKGINPVKTGTAPNLEGAAH